MNEPLPVEVRRSKRRTRTVSAYRKDDTYVVLIPARFSRSEEQHWVAEMVARLERKRADRPATRPDNDPELRRRATALARELGLSQPTSIRWVTNQNRRWGSCTPGEGTIRLSHRLQAFPNWVSDYVIVHELAHLDAHGHGPDFKALVARYTLAEKAEGWLQGFEAASGLDWADEEEW